MTENSAGVDLEVEGIDAAVADMPRRRQTRGGSRAQRWAPVWRGALGLFLLGLVMEAVTRAGLVQEAFLPRFSSILAEAISIFGRADFRSAIWATLQNWALGLALSTLIAVPLGVGLGLSRYAYRATRPLIEFFRPIPAVALIPLALLVLGNDTKMKMAVLLYACVWPILFNTIYGVRDVEPLAKEMARSYGVGRVTVIRRVVLPSAAPFIATGVRVSSSVALIVIITIELVAGGSAGLGAFIAAARATGSNVVLVYAATLVTGALGLAISLFLMSMERRLFGWHRTQGRGG